MAKYACRRFDGRDPDGIREHIAFHSRKPLKACRAFRECSTARKTILLCYESMPAHQEASFAKFSALLNFRSQAFAKAPVG
jgi:hypothetical protein